MSNKPEEVDIAFSIWYNKAQPLQEIISRSGRKFPQVEAKAITSAIRQAFVQGYALGVAAEAACPLPDDPELGPVR